MVFNLYISSIREKFNEGDTIENIAADLFFGQVGVRNQQSLYPWIPTTDVAKLLQYSGSRVEHGDGFSS